MRSSTAIISNIIGSLVDYIMANEENPPAEIPAAKPAECTPDTKKFTADDFFEMVRMFSYDGLMKYLEPLNEKLDEIGIRNNAALLYKLLAQIENKLSADSEKSRTAVLDFLTKHPDYFSQITHPADICNAICDVLRLIEIRYRDDDGRNVVAYKNAKLVKNTQFILSLFQPQLQAIDDYNVLSSMLERLNTRKTAYYDNEDDYGYMTLVNGSICSCVEAMLGAIKTKSQMKEVLESIAGHDVRYDIYNKWEGYWRERHANENPEPISASVKP